MHLLERLVLAALCVHVFACSMNTVTITHDFLHPGRLARCLLQVDVVALWMFIRSEGSSMCATPRYLNLCLPYVLDHRSTRSRHRQRVTNKCIYQLCSVYSNNSLQASAIILSCKALLNLAVCIFTAHDLVG